MNHQLFQCLLIKNQKLINHLFKHQYQHHNIHFVLIHFPFIITILLILLLNFLYLILLNLQLLVIIILKYLFQQFLENLDEEFGVGKFTCYVENFVNESIDVLDILELAEKDFDKLGITNIRIKAKLIRKAKQYYKEI